MYRHLSYFVYEFILMKLWKESKINVFGWVNIKDSTILFFDCPFLRRWPIAIDDVFLTLCVRAFELSSSSVSCFMFYWFWHIFDPIHTSISKMTFGLVHTQHVNEVSDVKSQQTISSYLYQLAKKKSRSFHVNIFHWPESDQSDFLEHLSSFTKNRFIKA